MDIKLKHPILTTTLVVAIAIIVAPTFFKNLSGHAVSSWLTTPNIPAKPDQPIIKSNVIVSPEVGQESAWTSQAIVKVTYPAVSGKSSMALANPGWSIEMGSFSNTTHALELQRKLQAQGYTVYLETTTKSSQETITRVLVGPEVKRDKAQALLMRINHDMNLKGILTSYDSLHLSHSKAG